jgi:hypothetical protein
MNREKVRKFFWVTLAGVIAFNIYFVRELLAAEILFALGLGVIFCLWFLFFLANEIGQKTAGVVRRHSGELAPARAEVLRVSQKTFEQVRSFSRFASEAFLRGLRSIPPFLSTAFGAARRRWAHVEVLARKSFQRSGSQAAH